MTAVKQHSTSGCFLLSRLVKPHRKTGLKKTRHFRRDEIATAQNIILVVIFYKLNPERKNAILTILFLLLRTLEKLYSDIVYLGCLFSLSFSGCEAQNAPLQESPLSS